MSKYSVSEQMAVIFKLSSMKDIIAINRSKLTNRVRIAYWDIENHIVALWRNSRNLGVAYHLASLEYVSNNNVFTLSRAAKSIHRSYKLNFIIVTDGTSTLMTWGEDPSVKSKFSGSNKSIK